MRRLGIVILSCLLAGTALQGADAGAKLATIKQQILGLNGDQIARWITGQKNQHNQREALHRCAATFCEYFKPLLSETENILLGLMTKACPTELHIQRTIIMLLSAIADESEIARNMLNPLLKTHLCNAISSFKLETWVQHFDSVTAPKSLLSLLAEGTLSAITSPTISDSEEESGDNSSIARGYASGD